MATTTDETDRYLALALALEEQGRHEAARIMLQRAEDHDDA